MDDADDSGARFCSLWSKVFEARGGYDQDHSCETILSYVRRALGHIEWTLCKGGCDEMRGNQKRIYTRP